MSTTFCLVAPLGAGNWPAAAALVNLTQRERDRYTFLLDGKFHPIYKDTNEN
jgi:hypothetical protein